MRWCLVQTQLQAVERGLALAEETGRDLCTQLSLEKDALLQVLELVSFQNGRVPRFHCSQSTLTAVSPKLRLLARLQAKRKNSELQQAYMELEREYLELQHKHSSHTATAEGTQQTIAELQAQLIHVQQELSVVRLDRKQYWEDYSQLLLINTELKQVCPDMFASLFVP